MNEEMTVKNSTRRGYHVLLVDLPGQGITPFEIGRAHV